MDEIGRPSADQSCDGCNVRYGHEHRCHSEGGQGFYVASAAADTFKFVGECPCRECREVRRLHERFEASPYIELRDDKAILHFEGREWLYVVEQDWFEWIEPITGEPTRISRGLAEMIAT